jgi:hypothetical protein
VDVTCFDRTRAPMTERSAGSSATATTSLGRTPGMPTQPRVGGPGGEAPPGGVWRLAPGAGPGVWVREWAVLWVAGALAVLPWLLLKLPWLAQA